MKFLTLENGLLGVLVGDVVVDIAAAGRALSVQSQADTLEALVVAGEELTASVWALAQQAVAENCACRPFSEVKPLAPIPVPRRNILCLGKNYLDHAQEIAAKLQVSQRAPAQPIIFTEATTAGIGPGEPRPAYPAYSQKLDYEAELALLIGRGG